MDTFFLYWKLILIHGCCHVTFLVIILLLRAKCFTNTSLSTQPQMKCFSLENRTEPRHHLVVSCSDSVQFLLMGQWEQFRAAWRPAVLAIAAPGPIAGRAWHFCCSPRFVPESGGVEPADSARPAAAPYSSAGRNRRRPHLACREPKLLNTNLLGHKQQYANVDESIMSRGPIYVVRWCVRGANCYLLALVCLAWTQPLPSDSGLPAAWHDLCPWLLCGPE